MTSMAPYLHFDGKAEEAMKCYKSIFGGSFKILQRYKDMAGGMKISEEDQDRIIHISLLLDNGITLMASDFLSSMEMQVNPSNNFHICIQAENEQEADKLFSEISDGGWIDMPLNRTFWGDYFGMCSDKFGVQWMINGTNNK